MTDLAEKITQLQQDFRESNSVEDLLAILTNLAQFLSAEEEASDAHNLVIDIFSTLQDLTADNEALGRQLIIDYLLPYLETVDSDAGRIGYIIARARDTLIVWMNQYPTAVQIGLRDHILDYLLERLRGPHPQSVCWTIGRLGYRHPRIVAALWAVVNTADFETGNVALAALSLLGVPPAERPPFLAALHTRVAQGWSLPLYTTLRRLADPTSLNVITTAWLEPVSPDENTGPPWLALGLPSDIADAHPTDEALQDRVWHLMTALFTQQPERFFTVLYGGDTAAQCDSPLVVPTLLSWLVREGRDRADAARQRFILYHRLKECIRPRQLLGWAQAVDESAAALLQQDACTDTGSARRFVTQESITKNLAWIQTLCWGPSAALTWFDPAVTQEASPYVRAHLCDLLAAFRYDPLPTLAVQWVTESRDLQAHSDDGELLAHLAAVRLVASAATPEAFEALRHCGFTYDGQVPLEVVNLLADVAATRIRAGDSRIIPALLATATEGKESHHRLAAAGALEDLATEELIPAEYAPRIAALVQDNNRDDFTRGVFVALLGTLPRGTLPESVLPLLLQWARERDEWIGIYSLGTLANHGYLIAQPILLTERLGLQLEGDTWNTAPHASRGEWDAWVIGRLYAEHPSPFTLAVATIVRSWPWPAAQQVIQILQNTHGAPGQPPLPTSLVEALLDRIHQHQSISYSEPPLFVVLSRLAPAALARAAWQPLWSAWHPTARTALADALGTAHYSDAAAIASAVAQLYALAADPQYSVRRAAYRSLARQAPAALQELCQDWAETAEVARRQRAAEAWSWLPTDQLLADTLYQTLVVDTEREVRAAAARTWQEGRRRTWGAMYLERVLAVTGTAETVSAVNNEMFQAWRYGYAFTHTGDDAAIEALEERLATSLIPPHIGHWLRQLLKDTQENWEKGIKKWPDPGLPWHGTIEEGAGSVYLLDGTEMPIRYAVWHEPAASPKEKTAWGGSFWASAERAPVGEEVVLQLSDGRRGRVLLLKSSSASGMYAFAGQARYPEQPEA